MKHLKIKHITRHQYESTVSFSVHSLYLRPLDSHRRRVNKFNVETIPASTQRWVRDAYGNIVLVCNFGLDESDLLEFRTEIEMSVDEENPFDFILEPDATAFPLIYKPSDKQALLPFMDTSAKSGSLKVLDWFYTAVDKPNQHPDVVQFLADINAAVRRDIAYVRRDEEGIQDPDATLALRTGSCRDMAVLFIATVRQLGLAARFVSGYLYDPPADEGDGDAHMYNRAVGSMHAWAEVYLPGAGWKGFDPTNGILANGYFVPSAVTHDPLRVNPIQGSYYSKQAVESKMEIELIIEE